MAGSFAVMWPLNFKNDRNFEPKEEEISVPGIQEQMRETKLFLFVVSLE